MKDVMDWLKLPQSEWKNIPPSDWRKISRRWRDRPKLLRQLDDATAQKQGAKRLLKQARGNAKRRKITFSITLSDICVPKLCPVFGKPLVWDGPTEWRPSLDRIRNNRGYVKGNVIVISYRANRLKADASLAELRALADFFSPRQT